MQIHGGNNNEWTKAVRCNNGRGRRRVFGSTTKCKAKTVISGDQITINYDGNVSAVKTPQLEDKYLNARIDRIKLTIPGTFMRSVLSSLERIFDDRPLAIIRSFGIGSFEHGSGSTYQLILLEMIKKHFGVRFITSQDPLTNGVERRFMQSCGIRVLPPDDLRSTPPTLNSTDEFTLLYMIHCTQDMYNSVLSRYWTNTALRRVIIIGNDPRSISVTLTANLGQDVPYFSRFCHICTSFSLPYFEPDDNAFLGTAICYFESEEEDLLDLG